VNHARQFKRGWPKPPKTCHAPGPDGFSLCQACFWPADSERVEVTCKRCLRSLAKSEQEVGGESVRPRSIEGREAASHHP
jgi:hypothetical protein